jgi:uncharacterized OB-fold protein
MATTDLALPRPTELSRPFWAAAREQRLVLQKCGACGAFRWTPQILCRRCLAEAFDWIEVSGKGTVYSFTIVHRAPTPAFETPYLLVVVELDEGPLMLTRLIDCAFEDAAIGQCVEVCFTRASDEISLYTFRPARV